MTKDYPLFILKTTMNQERNVATLLEEKVRNKDIAVSAILAPETLKGYIFIEAIDEGAVQEAIEGIRHVRGILPGHVPFEEVENFFEEKPAVEGIKPGDIVELVAGPFKGERAKVVRIDENKEELTVELLEVTIPIPVTVNGSYVRIIEKVSHEE
ncbi:MAG TPA: transcription elongation factor Spt5 [Methanomicrobia archaeon]|nr:MAG: transcription elongation factor Spt5 [archaeon]HHN81443.1 transcription elongation factor Spt5 [Methanomicrobia archaeon]